jgi:hypothetical protein
VILHTTADRPAREMTMLVRMRLPVLIVGASALLATALAAHGEAREGEDAE